MKVIFLDVDGVLNHDEFFSRRFDADTHIVPWDIDMRCVQRLRRIVEYTGARIVLSSTWRLGKPTLDIVSDALRSEGLEIMSKTPLLQGPRRDEINHWLSVNKHLGVSRIAILDDDVDADIGHSFFRTSWKSGLDNEITGAVIQHLNAEE